MKAENILWLGDLSIRLIRMLILPVVLVTVINGATPEQIALVVGFTLAFDRPLDMWRTLVNVRGNLAVATLVEKWEDEFDEEVCENS